MQVSSFWNLGNGSCIISEEVPWADYGPWSSPTGYTNSGWWLFHKPLFDYLAYSLSVRACSPRVSVGFLRVLQFPPHSPKTCWWGGLDMPNWLLECVCVCRVASGSKTWAKSNVCVQIIPMKRTPEMSGNNAIGTWMGLV